MKKTVCLLALGLLCSTALAGCGPDKTSSSGGGITSGTTSNVKTIAEVLALFDGTMGVEGYKLKSGEAVSPEVTIEGTYIGGGDGSYSGDKKRAGYIQDASGKTIYLHIVDASQGDSATKEIVPGAKIRVTGTVTAYHELPQFAANWKYELIEAADLTDAGATKLKSFYKEVTLDDIYSNPERTQAKPEILLQPILLKNMVLSGAVSEGSETYFTPLSELGLNKKGITAYRFAGAGVASDVFIPGATFDLYACVTAYKNKPQLNTSIYKASNKFNSAYRVEAKDLTGEQNLIANEYTTALTFESPVKFNYYEDLSKQVEDFNATLAQPLNGVKAIWSSSDEAVAAIAQEEIAPGKFKNVIKFKADKVGSPVVNASRNVKITRKLCIPSMSEADCAAATKGSKGQVTIKTFNIVTNHNYTLEAANKGDFSAGTMPAGYAYVSPKGYGPSFEKKDPVVKGLKLIYANDKLLTPDMLGGKTFTIVVNYSFSHYVPKDGTKEASAYSWKLTGRNLKGELLTKESMTFDFTAAELPDTVAYTTGLTKTFVITTKTDINSVEIELTKSVQSTVAINDISITSVK